MLIIALLITFAWAVGCLLFDALNTNKGLRAGIAQEGNSLVTFLSRTQTPKLWQLLTIEGTVRVLLLLAAFLLPTPVDLPHCWHACSLGVFIAYGLKNIQGGRQWRWMFNNPGKALPIPHTVWEKFLGFWG
jgi:uncharacterized membrane protein YczE